MTGGIVMGGVVMAGTVPARCGMVVVVVLVDLVVVVVVDVVVVVAGSVTGVVVGGAVRRATVVGAVLVVARISGTARMLVDVVDTTISIGEGGSIRPASMTYPGGSARTNSVGPAPMPIAAAVKPATAVIAGAAPAVTMPGGNRDSWVSQDSGPIAIRSLPNEMLRKARTIAGSNCVPAQSASSWRAAAAGLAS